MIEKFEMVNMSRIKITSKYTRDTGDVSELVESIKKTGFWEPIIINKKYELKSGGRRYHAAKICNLKKIPAITISGSTMEEELVIILSRIQQKPANSVERDYLIYRQKQIWTELYPETRQGVAPRLKEKGIEVPEKFIATTAKKLNVGEKSLYRACARAERSSKRVADARKRGLISTSDADHLIKLEEKDQDQMIHLVKEFKWVGARRLVNMALNEDIGIHGIRTHLEETNKEVTKLEIAILSASKMCEIVKDKIDNGEIKELPSATIKIVKKLRKLSLNLIHSKKEATGPSTVLRKKTQPENQPEMTM